MRMGSRAPAVLLLLALLLAGTIGGALPARADDGPKPLAPRRLFDQSRPGVELVTAEFTGELEVPEPIITAANERALRARVLDRIQRGEVPASEAAAQTAVIQEIVRDPLRWFTPSDRVERTDFKVLAMGSGFSISADGYIVTNAHVVAPASETLKATFLREGMGEGFQDSIERLVAGGLPQSLATKLLEAGLRWATKKSKLSHFKRRLETTTSSGTGGTDYSSGGRAAKLVVAGKEIPGKDVAVIKVDARNMATVQLGDDTALSAGDRLFVLGFPGPATFSPVLSKDSEKEPTLTQGVLSAKKTTSKGFTVLQTDAAMTHGNSGGPVFDDRGRVVGVATFGSVDPKTGREVAGLNFAVPASVVNEMLSRAKVKPFQGTATKKYRLALDAIDKHWYKRALPLLQEVKRLDPLQPSVEKLIKASQDGIAQGRDQTPREILGLPLPSFAGAAAAVGLLAIAVLARTLTLVRRRRRRRRERPAVEPGWRDPGAPWAMAPEPPVAPVEPGWGDPGAPWAMAPVPPGPPEAPVAPVEPASAPAEYLAPAAPVGFGANGNGSAYPWWQTADQTADQTAELPVVAPEPIAAPEPVATPAAGMWDGVARRPRAEQAQQRTACWSCGHPNQPTNRFCEQCWSALGS
jgi:serine protease Do